MSDWRVKFQSDKQYKDCRLTDMTNIEKAKDLINALIKARKNLRMYPVNHPIYEKTVDDFNLKMFSCLEVDTIKIRINQYDIYFDDEVIYHSKDKDESLALFFFKDGLREMSFSHGITRNEINEFLRIISLDFEKDVLDDDIVTLLWEEDFQHIKYVVDDAFLFEDEGYVQNAVEQAKSVSSRSAEIMKVYESAISIESSPKVDIVPITDDDIQRIAKEIENDPPDKSHTLIRMLFEILYLAQKKDEYEVISRWIEQTLEYAMTNGNMEIVNYVLTNTNGNSKSYVYHEQVQGLLKNIENYINSAAFIKLFGDVINNRGDIPGELLQKFSSLLNSNSIPHFISILDKMNDISSRRIVLSILTEVGRKDVALVAKGLNSRKWYVVRNIVYVLRQIGDKSSVQHLVKIAGHHDKRVRKEAVHALGEMGSDEVLHILKEHMSDEVSSVRIAAFRAAGQMGTELSKKVILEQIGSKQFRDKSFAEKKEIFQVLSRWKEKDVIDFLVKIATKRIFFKRVKNNETRAVAMQCLGLLRADNVRQIAERYKNSNNTLLRKQALEILRGH